MTDTNSSNMSSAESLALIESMINKAKNKFSENGHLYLLWGWVVFICSLVQYLGMRFTSYENVHFIWMLTWVAVVYMVFYLIKYKKQQKVVTYTDELLSAIWIAFSITMCITGIIIGKTQGAEFYKLLNPIYLTIYGVPTYVSGVVLKFKPLKIGALLCWGMAILSTFIPVQDHLLLIALAMVVAWIIPGYLLKQRYEKQQ
ncbi:hypothetical protein [Flavihumibacter sp. UBA7668]|uniref:hypothetical protein n=1 Tax=Flavihumibacter sp. UBA7668 TaxID=1946542 RepID=UPI0025BF63BE|nr:hypothetical protein [Flavihumibacter sp. UBA7668]